MKRIATILVIAALFSANLKPIQAQEDTNRWDARIGIGSFGITDLIPTFIIGFSDGTSGSGKGFRFVPLATPNFEMSYKFNNTLSLGGQLTLGYAGVDKTGQFWDEDGNSIQEIKAHMIYPTLMINLKTNYIQKDTFSMYGLWGLGTSIYAYFRPNSSELFAFPMFNFYPLCFSTNKDNGFFMELGWGSKGFINLGWEIKL